MSSGKVIKSATQAEVPAVNNFTGSDGSLGVDVFIAAIFYGFCITSSQNSLNNALMYTRFLIDI